MRQSSRQTSSLTSVTVKVLLVLVSLAFTLLLGEMGVRGISIGTYHQPIIVSDPLAGWANKPDLEKVTVIFGGSQFTLRTDREGHRSCYPNNQAPPANIPAVLTVGDSFVQGIGVDDEQTFAWKLARQTPYNVINLGVVGYGTEQELVKLEEFLAARPNLQVKHIIVLVFDNDFTDVQKSSDPHLGRSKPKFHTVGQSLARDEYKLPWSDYFMDNSRLFWLLKSKLAQVISHSTPPSERGIDLVLACLRAMRRLADSRGTQIHIFAYHRLRGPMLLNESTWRGFVEQSGAIDITDRVRAAQELNPIGSDGVHWSAAGHALVADTLLELSLIEDNDRTR